MRFLIISHTIHKNKGLKLMGYLPYVREMNIWLKYADSVEIVAPFTNDDPTSIDLEYDHNNIDFNKIVGLNFTTAKTALKSLFNISLILMKMIAACKRADHIHLRCPGNIGLLGCFVQILFPKKVKTAKYAGNWTPKAKQPLSYRIQKMILLNTFLTKNMTALVYGLWPNQTKNIKPFFTATFNTSEIEPYKTRDYSQNLKFVFVGSLVKGKRPLLAIKIIENIIKNGKQGTLDIYGNGALKHDLKTYIENHNLNESVTLHGNQPISIIKSALKESHFVILPSKSEGWPKVLAEGMFFGLIPISTKISCIPWMLDYGKRGILIEPDSNEATNKILTVLKNRDLNEMSEFAQSWSQKFTLDNFENEIRKLMVV